MTRQTLHLVYLITSQYDETNITFSVLNYESIIT
jgi:hypothetical protein